MENSKKIYFETRRVFLNFFGFWPFIVFSFSATHTAYRIRCTNEILHFAAYTWNRGLVYSRPHHCMRTHTHAHARELRFTLLTLFSLFRFSLLSRSHTEWAAAAAAATVTGGGYTHAQRAVIVMAAAAESWDADKILVVYSHTHASTHARTTHEHTHEHAALTRSDTGRGVWTPLAVVGPACLYGTG